MQGLQHRRGHDQIAHGAQGDEQYAPHVLQGVPYHGASPSLLTWPSTASATAAMGMLAMSWPP